MSTMTSPAEHKVSIPVDNELAIAITTECLRSTYMDAKSLRPGFVDPKDLKAFRRVLRWFGEEIR